MTATTDNATTPFSRLSRFNLVHKSPPTAPTKRDEDWYIPYNGPYEPPKQPLRNEPERDSWGQVVDGIEHVDDDMDEVILGDKDLQRRYGALPPERRPRLTECVNSNVSGRTKSSGIIDPNRARANSLSPRKVHPSSPKAPVHLDHRALNGVGATPTPAQRVTPPHSNSRSSLAQFFSFSPRKSTPLHEYKEKESIAPTPHPHTRSTHSPTFSPSLHPYASGAAYTRSQGPETRHPGTAPLSGRFPSQHQQPVHPLRKTSASTPNLRNEALSARTAKARLPKGKDKWFSPETWCDALFLPRPRFKLKDDSQGSGRIVSPPDSPISPYLPSGQAFASGVESRVLAHSRSLVDLQPKSPPGFERRGFGSLLYVGQPEPNPTIQPSRPKSFALDDLALPSPIPSLSKVLEEGDNLEQQRKEWQNQAVRSFQNSLSRNVSRSRSKSVGAKRKLADTPLEFLTARTVLGSQSRMPTVVVSAPKTHDGSSGGRMSHSHKSSLTKTTSTVSAKSRGHSRDESWGRTAINIAKGSTALCGLHGDYGSTSHLPSSDTTNNHNTTKHIDFAKTHAHTQEDRSSQISPRAAYSPVPSTLSGSRVGIALSTPPPPSDISHATYDAESLRIFSHPYAQGNGHTFRSPPSGSRNTPSPEAWTNGTRDAHSTTSRFESLGSNAETVALLSSHPPSRTLAAHPYAQSPVIAQDNNDLVRRLRSDSNISPSSKMWAPVAPGVVREVLPRELQYSPVVGDTSNRNGNSQQQKLRDRVSVGEALSLAMFSGRRDSALDDRRDYKPTKATAGYSETYSSQPGSGSYHRVTDSGGGSLRNRVPVQYDAARPVFQQPTVSSNDHGPAETPPNNRNNSSESSKSAGLGSQYSSPPLSPRPLGADDDLENFRDLFFKPKTSDHESMFTQSTNVPSTWTEDHLHNHRRGSGLTALVRQLSQESEGIQSEDSQRNYSTREPRENLEFVLAEDRDSDFTTHSGTRPLRISDHKLNAFRPSGAIPEDVEVSSMLEPMLDDEDDTAHVRILDVSALATTPPTRFSDHRNSQHISYNDPPDDMEDDTIHAIQSPLLLQPPQPQIRESFATSSTSQSSMSGLSDFPAPPAHALTPAHTSILESFFDNIPPSSHRTRTPSPSRRQTFGNFDTLTSP